jgi:outer membrane protein assembly factor BamB/tetratricopeptide (TPR) repeat protein
MEEVRGLSVTRGGIPMACRLRAPLVVLFVALLVTATYLASCRGASEAPDGNARPPADLDKRPGGTDALILPTDRQLTRRLEAAAEYLRAGSWSDAVRLLQLVLDAPEDVFVSRRRPGRPVAWVSARTEALGMLATLPPQGRDFYQVHFGGPARARLQQARTANDPDLLKEVARRYPYTTAGIEALDLLGTHELDRGRLAPAASCFRLLLERQPADRVAPVTLYKAALAFHAAGGAAAERTWRQLADRVGPDGLRLGARTVRLPELREEIDRFRARSERGDEVRVFRGDARRSGQAAGTIPYLEPRWQQPTADREETRAWLRRALRAQEEGMQPSIPGACPLLVAGLLVYRSHSGVCAVDPRTGTREWHTDLPLSLDACLADVRTGKKVSTEDWLRKYAPTAGVTVAGLGALGGVGGGMNPGAGAGQPGPAPYAPPLLFENTTLGTLSSDGRRVYAVDDLAVPPPPVVLQEQPGVRRPLGPLGPQVRYNRLLALNVATGKAVWERGGPAPPRGRKPARRDADQDDLHDSYFLGPPLPVAGQLFVLVEKQGEVVLSCLHGASGDVAWSQPLGVVREKLPADVGRRTQAVHLAYADGILICPSNAGAVVAVDPLTRTLLWAYTYHERPAPTPEGGAPPPEPPAIPPESGPAWKASAPVVHDGKVLLTAADDDALHCVNLRDGTLLWRRPRTDDDVYLAGAWRDRVVLVGKTVCRGVSLADGGKTFWSAATGLPSGLGVLNGNVLYLPLRKGAVCALDVASGKVVARAEVRGGGAPGNLLFHGGELLSQSVTAVTAYPELNAKLAALDVRLKRDPHDPAGLAERGDLRLHQGDVEGAVADLRQALAGGPPADVAAAAPEHLYEALTRLLCRDFAAGERYLAEYRKLCRLPVPEGADEATRRRLEAERQRRETALLCLLARARERRAGRPVEVLRAYLDLARHDAGGRLVTSLEDPAVQARLDVWARGRVAGLFARADAAGAKALHEEVVREWRRAKADDDPAALERFAALFGELCAEGREARLLLAERWSDDPYHGRALAAELTLLRLRLQADHPERAARATLALARLLTRKGLPEDALVYYRALARDFPRVPIRDGKTGADFLNDLRDDRRFLAYLEAPPAWAGGRIRAERPPDLAARDLGPAATAAAPGAPVPQVLTFHFGGELTPFLESHVLVLDLTTSRLRLLDRSTGAEVWAESLALGPLRGHLLQNGLVGSVLPCPVQGHLAFVNLGAVLYGVDLLDHRVLWKRSPVDGPFLPGRMAVAPREGDPESCQALQLVGVDRFGRGETRVLGRLGPSTGEYVALQTAAGLVALDPARGEELWVRGDVAADADSFGDGRDIFLVERGACATRAVRARDGLPVAGVPAFGAVHAHKVAAPAGRLLAVETDDVLVLRLYDLRTGKVLWKTTGPKGAVMVQSADPSLAGWVGRDGQVVVFEARTGRRVLWTKIDPAHVAGVNEVRLLGDAKHLYLTFNSEPGPNGGGGEVFSCLTGLTSVPVNGMVYAFDRATGDVCWFNRVSSQMLLTEQFERLPILLFADGVNRQVGGTTVPTLQVLSIDKETGKRLLGYTVPNAATVFHTLRVDLPRKTIDLVGLNLRVRHVEAGAKP